MAALTRDQQRTGTVYVLPDGETSFFTPDGEGRIYFDSLQEARDETGINVVAYLDETPDDF
jgi:hypothetical protein